MTCDTVVDPLSHPTRKSHMCVVVVDIVSLHACDQTCTKARMQLMHACRLVCMQEHTTQAHTPSCMRRHKMRLTGGSDRWQRNGMYVCVYVCVLSVCVCVCVCASCVLRVCASCVRVSRRLLLFRRVLCVSLQIHACSRYEYRASPNTSVSHAQAHTQHTQHTAHTQKHAAEHRHTRQHSHRYACCIHAAYTYIHIPHTTYTCT